MRLVSGEVGRSDRSAHGGVVPKAFGVACPGMADGDEADGDEIVGLEDGVFVLVGGVAGWPGGSSNGVISLAPGAFNEGVVAGGV